MRWKQEKQLQGLSVEILKVPEHAEYVFKHKCEVIK